MTSNHGATTTLSGAMHTYHASRMGESGVPDNACPACHGSPHAIYPSMLALDNQQSIRLQGSAGTITDCTVCHIRRPGESFFHLGEDD